MEIQDALRIAAEPAVGLDGRLGGIVLLSLGVSLTAFQIGGKPPFFPNARKAGS